MPNQNQTGLRHAFLHQGHMVIKDCLPSQLFFNMAYELYDEITYGQVSKCNACPLGEFKALAAEWNGKPCNRRFYSGAPVGARDRRMRSDKAEKTYFQYTREFGHFLRGHSQSVMDRSVALEAFCTALDALILDSERIFRAAIDMLIEGGDTVLNEHFPQSASLPILIKFIAYHPAERWATTPHYDKSVLTLVLNADDIDEDSFRIGPNALGSSLENLDAPSRSKQSCFERSNGVLFPGLFANPLGLKNIPPSPHGVLPFEKPRLRHSAIAFLMAPGVTSENMTTSLAA